MSFASPSNFNSSTEVLTIRKEVAIDHAMLFIKRSAVRSLVARELHNCGIATVVVLDRVGDCIEELRKNPESLLVVDWEFGELTVIKVLRAAQGACRIDTRPIYCIALDMDARVISVANEYNVMQIHTGEISQEQVIQNLEELLHFSTLSAACRKVFRILAKLRLNSQSSEAEPLLRKLCKSEPDNIRAAVELGALLFENERFSEALTWMRQVEAVSQGDLRAQHMLARCLMKLGEFDEAKQLLEQSNLINPNNVDRLVDLGQILLRMNKGDEALSKFDLALAMDNDLKEAKVGKAQCSLLKNHVNEAIKLLGQIDNAQELASIFNDTAILAIRQSRFKQGLSLYKSSINYVSGDNKVLARILFNMGVGLVKWGKFTQALAAFEQSASLDTNYDKAKHNVIVIKSMNSNKHNMTKPERIQALETADQQDEDFSQVDFGLVRGKDKSLEVEVDPDDNSLDERFFQSLMSGGWVPLRASEIALFPHAACSKSKSMLK